MWRSIQADYVVVGSGIAGLTVSLLASRYGRVALVTMDRLGDGNSRFAQGGIAAAIGDDDQPEFHHGDTIRTGVGLSESQSVYTLVEAAPEVIRFLLELGVSFDRNEKGRLVLGREGAHGRNRIVHAGGDATGKAVVDALIRKVLSSPRISIFEHCYAAELFVIDAGCRGVMAVHREQHPFFFQGRAVVLANGGLGQLYRYTTNDIGVMGSGYAMAYRAGAELRDMEFVQFHPTALKIDSNPMPLISEAVRGEGAVLINSDEEAFMVRYHPWKDLASRDVVSRAIYAEYKAGQKVYLDARSITHFSKRFPTITNQCREYGIDPLRHPIPVVPAAHYTMGGIKTDTYGRTSLPGLYAVGEVASTGVHGANRLASNSLLEGAVFAKRVAQTLSEEQGTITMYKPHRSPKEFIKQWGKPDAYLKQQVQKLMWEAVGLIRNEKQLAQACGQLEEWLCGASSLVDQNMLTTALLVTKGALMRKESRGSHYRMDYPDTNPECQVHSIQVRNEQPVFC